MNIIISPIICARTGERLNEMKNKRVKNEEKIPFFSKMSTKTAIVISAIFLVTIITQIFVASNRASKAMERVYLNYAQNLAEEAVIGVDFATEFGEEAYGGYAKNLAQEAAVSINFSRQFGESVYKSYAQNLAEEAATSINLAAKLGPLSLEILNGILKDIAIKDVKGSYSYMVSPTGTMLWHPDAKKIGQPVENAAVKSIVSDLRAGRKIENGSVLYEYKNALKLAGYAFTSEGNILIVTADYNEFMKIDYDTLLGKINIDGVEGSYAYMVSPTGTMLWHPDSKKIGQPVENAAVKGIVSKLGANQAVEDGYVTYEYRGSTKLAGYSFTDTGNIVLVTADYDKLIVIDYDKLIGEIEISGVSGSYAYMVSPNGTMLYHKNAEKIGLPVENAAVKGIIADIKAGRKVSEGSCSYEYKGAYKVAGYDFTKSGNIVIITADRDVMMSAVASMRRSLILYGVVCEIMAVIFVYFFTVYMLKGLKAIVPVINKTANFDFSGDQESERLEVRSDEIGLIARTLAKTRDNLRSVIEAILNASKSINGNVDELNLTIERVGNICGDNSSVAEKLSSSMQETAATTKSITQNAENVKEDAHNINKLAEDGTDLSSEVLSRANELSATIGKASQRTIELYEEVRKKADDAIIASHAVNKINELTETIMAISSKTGVLSLNASIEAARAGEMGRGFTVVASEIRNMSGQISDAVRSISAIVEEITSAFKQMSDCLGQTTSFLESNVLSDYQEFSNVSKQYKDDADTFGSSMETIKKSIKNLDNEIEDIVGSISNIDTMVSESSTGVSDIADKTSKMVNETSGSADQVSECKKAVTDLNDIINKFSL